MIEQVQNADKENADKENADKQNMTVKDDASQCVSAPAELTPEPARKRLRKMKCDDALPAEDPLVCFSNLLLRNDLTILLV